ncbi:unnamed protein product [Allacma fusca]|uniref:Cyclic AMP-responsive element-binding protein 1 n=1 Tax=Allacma fusca TaxID=39272 RepID=A0A8J2JZH8_9HEXA|nr:unnamed protein product [Allacma fusca]
MEVLVQEVKSETIVPDVGETSPNQRKITILNTGAVTSGNTFVKTSQNNNIITSSTPSVIQSPSVIQNTAGLQLSKGNVILVSSKANTGVIQTTGGALQTVQVLEAHHSDESLSNDGVDHQPEGGRQDRIRREILTRRPSYRKILNDLGGPEISGDKDSASNSESSQEATDGGIVIGGTQYPPGVVKVINANALGLSQVTTADGTAVPAGALQTITMTNAGTAGGTIVQYAQSQDGQQFFVPGWSEFGGELQAYTIRPVSSSSSSPSVVVAGGSLSSGHHVPEEATRKREIRLLKNREAARECRRKKKEYIKCLENRVAVLENQNKALIDELKSLKELYCQQKTE